jgi:hypothetical protein
MNPAAAATATMPARTSAVQPQHRRSRAGRRASGRWIHQHRRGVDRGHVDRPRGADRRRLQRDGGCTAGAVRRLLGGQRLDQLGYWRRDVRAEGRKLIVEVGQRRTHVRLTAKRRAAGQAVVRDDAQRVEVGLRRRRPAGGLFGTEVVDGPDQRPGLGERFTRGRTRDAEVHEHGSPGRGDHDVGRLEVAVHDAAVVHGLQSLGDLQHDGEHLLGGK